MLNDDDLPTKKPKRMQPPVLDLLSLEELRGPAHVRNALDRP